MAFNKAFLFTVLLCIGGVTVRAQVVVGTGNNEVVILPAPYTTDSNFEDKGSVKTKLSKKNGDFKTELERIAAKAAGEGGNVLRLTRIEDHKHKGIYRFWGRVYHINNPATLKDALKRKQQQPFSDGPCGYLVIYRPDYDLGFNDDSIKYSVMVNDTMALPMRSGNTKYIIKVRHEGTVKLTINRGVFVQNMNVSVKTGHVSYVRNYVNFPGSHKSVKTGDYLMRLHGYTPYLEAIDDALQGEVESAMVTKAVVAKTL